MSLNIGALSIKLGHDLAGDLRIWVHHVSDDRSKGVEWHVTMNALVEDAIKYHLGRDTLPRLRKALQEAIATIEQAEGPAT